MEIGSSLNHYRIVELLGRGGMGAVYRAEDTRLKRDVAIKVLPAELAADQERLARMEREAQVLAALDHNNIAAIYGLEEADGVRFLVMQLAEGATLADRITAGPIPLEEALPIALSITEALEAAHARGIVHRDLKPANIQIGADGKVTLLDFGLAKVYETAAGDSSEHQTMAESPTFVQATQAGVILGTAPYMSPEQARGQMVDARSDTWAFGCVLYEMLSGGGAFAGPTVTDVLGSIVHKDPDWDELPRRTPRRIRMMMHRCLRKDPVRRLQAIGDARIAIQEYMEDPRSVEAILEAPPVGAAWQRIAPWALAAVGLLAAGWMAIGGSGVVGPGESIKVSMALDADPLFSGVGSSLALTPDGTRLVYAVATAGGMAIRVRSLTDGTTNELAQGPSTYQPFISPDGNWVGFATRSEIQRVPITGGTPLPIAAVSRARGAAWGPNDEIVYTPNPDSGLLLVPVSGGDPEVLTSLGDGEMTHRWPQILAGGQIIFTSHTSTASFDDAAIEILDPETRERTVLVRGGFQGRYSAELETLLYVNSGTLFGIAMDLDTMTVSGNPIPLIVDLTAAGSEGAAQFEFAANGRAVYSLGGSVEPSYTVLWVDSFGRSEVLWGERQTYGEPQVSPDGTRVSFIVLDDDNWDIWVYDLGRDVATRLTFAPGADAPALWSPDGSEVMFSSARDGDGYNIYRKSADGSGEPTRLTAAGADSFVYDWGSTGHALLSSDSDLWILDVESGDLSPYFETVGFTEQEAKFSPNGRWVAYMSDESGRNEIYVRPFPLAGGKWQVSAAGGSYPRWSADGTRLFFRIDEGVMAAAVSTDGTTFQAGRPEIVFSGSYRGGMNGLSVGGFTAADYYPHPDGERFVMFTPDDSEVLGVQLLHFETGWLRKAGAQLARNR